jgi:hypothetical protein
MHAPKLLSALVVVALLLAGCTNGEEPLVTDEKQPAAKPPRGTEAPTGKVSWFTADRATGEAPVEVTFLYVFETNDQSATWTLDFGDGSSENGGASADRGNIKHTYTIGGSIETWFTLTYGDGKTDGRMVLLEIEPPLVLPDPHVFEFGPTPGCVGDFATCLSKELGPEHSGVDGHWVPLDESYWGLQFVVTNEGIPYEDTDCAAFFESMDQIGTDLNGGGGPCGGLLPRQTAWLFLYSYAAPTPGLKLEFSIPE